MSTFGPKSGGPLAVNVPPPGGVTVPPDPPVPPVVVGPVVPGGLVVPVPVVPPLVVMPPAVPLDAPPLPKPPLALVLPPLLLLPPPVVVVEAGSRPETGAEHAHRRAALEATARRRQEWDDMEPRTEMENRLEGQTAAYRDERQRAGPTKSVQPPLYVPSRRDPLRK